MSRGRKIQKGTHYKSGGCPDSTQNRHTTSWHIQSLCDKDFYLIVVVSLTSEVLLVSEKEEQKCCWSIVKFHFFYTRDSRLSALTEVPAMMVPLSQDWRVVSSSCVPMRFSMALYRNWYCSWKTGQQLLIYWTGLTYCSKSALLLAMHSGVSML